MRQHSTEAKLLSLLERRAEEQASIEKSSPLPGWIRPTASFVGTNVFWSLLVFSLFFSLAFSTFFFKEVYTLYLKGVLGWLIH